MSTTIAGRLSRDPVPSAPKTGRGSTVRTRFGVVTTRQWINRKTLLPEESSNLVEVSCRGVLAENLIASLRQGDRVIVTGELQTVRWESQSGEHSRLELMAEEVGLSLSRHRIDPPSDDEPEDVA
jgi:single-strand DNA-binding protein